MTREASGDGVKVTNTGERADSAPINGSYTVKYDGKEVPVTGAPYDTIVIKQVNAPYVHDHAEDERQQIQCNGPGCALEGRKDHDRHCKR